MSKEESAAGSLKDPVMLDDSDEEDEPAKAAAASSTKTTTTSSTPIEIIDDSDDDGGGEMERKPAAVSTINHLPMSPRSQMRGIRDAAKRRWKKAQVESPEQVTTATEASPTNSSSAASTKKPRIEGNEKQHHQQKESSGPQVPIKILTSERPGPSTNPLHAKHCRTLRQLLGFDAGPEEIKCGIDWLVIFNYVIDFNYVLGSIPELVSIPKTIVFYGDGSDPHTWREACTLPNGKCTVEFRQLKPSDPAGSPTNPLKIKVPWGVHHTKMFLVGLANGSLRVIIMTANLLHNDISLKTQGAYIQDFPLKTAASNRYISCEFEKDLVNYLRTYNYEQRQTWSISSSESPRSFIAEIKRYDFSSASVILIPSTPGRSKLDNPKGYLKLAKAIRQHVPKRSSTKPIICQFSSIGSLNAKWLKEIAQSWNVAQTECTEQRLQLVYPTVDEIRGSVEGYQGGGSVPGTIKNTSKPFLQPLYHKWSAPSASSAEGGTTTAMNPLHKPMNVPHIKTFYQLTEDEMGMEWFCLTSHNLSKAAWGEKILSEGARRIFCRHWELGVLVLPQLLLGGNGDCKLVPAGGPDSSGGSLAKDQISIPLPFPLKPTRYDVSDRPWAVDGSYHFTDHVRQDNED